MATESTSLTSRSRERVRDEQAFLSGLRGRHLRGSLWLRFFQLSIVIGLIALLTLMGNVVNRIFGLIAIREAVPAAQIADRPLEELTSEELLTILVERVNGGPRAFVLNSVVGRDNLERPVGQVLGGVSLPAEIAAKSVREMSPEEATEVIRAALSQSDLLNAVYDQVVGRQLLEAWTFTDSVFNRAQIENEIATREEWAGARLEWRSWINSFFLTNRMDIDAIDSGVRTALLGSLLVILLTVLFAFPLGVGTAIYLEEYATGDSWLERVIETNIRNLAGVPSIIYGLLGLAIFVRALESITQGRSVISAALTMGLLILPVIIINAQEALRAVPPSIREASFGLGATRWQTIWNSVLPAAMPGILTGTILGLSRAVGETAPLIIVGAATFVATDPTLTSRFTVLPIQIYNWTRDPRQGFGEIAAATIVILLIVLLLFNAVAIYFRQRFRRKLSA